MSKLRDTLIVGMLVFLVLVMGFSFAIMPATKDKPKENKMECTCKPIAE